MLIRFVVVLTDLRITTNESVSINNKYVVVVVVVLFTRITVR